MICTVCIATYKRKELLKRLLNSLDEQKMQHDNIELQIIVVDNDSEKTAKDLVSFFRDRNGIKFEYHSQPVKNISLTRNVAVKNAKGDYLLFVDDDEVVVRNWINSMIDTALKYKADVVIGRALFQFENETPEWIRDFFRLNYQCPPTGTEPPRVYMGNCLIKTSIINDIEGPFDPKYGISGGEDAKLFRKLRKKGAKFVSCYEGAATEFIPIQSSTVRWILKRSFRQSFIFSYQSIEMEESNKFKIRIITTMKSVVYGLISCFLVIILFFDKYSRIKWSSKIASNIGHFLAACGYSLENFRS
jgi:succinoglycan biosynthesis protein ExoM